MVYTCISMVEGLRVHVARLLMSTSTGDFMEDMESMVYTGSLFNEASFHVNQLQTSYRACARGQTHPTFSGGRRECLAQGKVSVMRDMRAGTPMSIMTEGRHEHEF